MCHAEDSPDWWSLLRLRQNNQFQYRSGGKGLALLWDNQGSQDLLIYENWKNNAWITTLTKPNSWDFHITLEIKFESASCTSKDLNHLPYLLLPFPLRKNLDKKINSFHIPKEFRKNFERNPKKFPKKFPKKSQKIKMNSTKNPKQIEENSQKFPNKSSKNPKIFQKKSSFTEKFKNFQKNQELKKIPTILKICNSLHPTWRPKTLSGLFHLHKWKFFHPTCCYLSLPAY